MARKTRGLRTVVLLLGIPAQGAKSALAQSAPARHVLVVRVVDDATHLPLVNAQVIVIGTQKTNFTNDNGEARLLRTSEAPLSLHVRQIVGRRLSVDRRSAARLPQGNSSRRRAASARPSVTARHDRFTSL